MKEELLGSDSQKPSPGSPAWQRRLKFALGLVSILVLAGVAFIGAWGFKYHRIVSAKPGKLAKQIPSGELGRRVNPFIGTGGYPWVCSHNFPGAMVPFGMVRLGPETVSLLLHKRALNTSGYYYGDDQILGFSHTRLNGTGATEGGHFLVVPAIKAADPQALRQGQSTTFSHSEEAASPGYYAVRLPKLGVLAELTASQRVGIHRYTFTREDGPPPHYQCDECPGWPPQHRTERCECCRRPMKSRAQCEPSAAFP